MQNAPNSYPPSHLPIGLIKLCRNLWIGIVVVLASSMVANIIMGVISSAVYDMVKELLVGNVLIDVLFMVCLALVGALIYVISLLNVPDNTLQRKPKKSSSLVLKMTYVVLLFLIVCSA